MNGDGFWRGTPEQYDALVRLGASTIRAADPSAKILDGGLSSTAWGVVEAKALLDQGRTADALAAYNAYYERRFDRRTERLPPRQQRGRAPGGPGHAPVDREPGLRRHHVPSGQGRRHRCLPAPLLREVDERGRAHGLPEVEPAGRHADRGLGGRGVLARQHHRRERALAGETARLVYLLLGNGAERVIFLPMQSNTADSGTELRAGLLDANFQPRPGFDAIAHLAEFARQGGKDWRTVTGTDGAQAVVGTAPSGAQALLWSEQAPVAVSGLGPEVVLTSLDGTTGAGGWCDEGRQRPAGGLPPRPPLSSPASSAPEGFRPWARSRQLGGPAARTGPRCARRSRPAKRASISAGIGS